MDNLFVNNIYECRIDVTPEQLNKKLEQHLLANLRSRYENRCDPDFGYIKKGSILKIERRSVGGLVTEGFNGNITYNVTFKCQSAMPVKGSQLICKILVTNKAGLLGKVDGLPFYVGIFYDNPDNNKELIEKIRLGDDIAVTVSSFRINRGSQQTPAFYFINGIIRKYVEHIRRNALSAVENNFRNFMMSTFNMQLRNEPPSKWILPEKYFDHSSVARLMGLKENIRKLNERSGNLNFWKQYIRPAIFDYELVYPNKFGGGYETNVVLTKLLKERVPINRSFYKFVEIARQFDVVENANTILTLAECPGAFLQAIMHLKQYSISNIETGSTSSSSTSTSSSSDDQPDIYFAVSLPSNEKMTCAFTSTNGFHTKWQSLKDTAIGKKYGYDQITVTDPVDLDDFSEEDNLIDHIIQENVNAKARVGLFEADLTNPDVFAKMTNEVNNTQYQLITADGFVEDEDMTSSYHEFANQRILFAQIMYAVLLQDVGGAFILKTNDVTSPFTINLLTFVASYYTSIDVFKPRMSRTANSERYFIFRGYTSNDSNREVRTMAINVLRNWPQDESGSYVYNLFGDPNPDMSFIEDLKSFNTSIINVQTDAIEKGLEIAEKLLELRDKRDSAEIKRTFRSFKTSQLTASKKLIEELRLETIDDIPDFSDVEV